MPIRRLPHHTTSRNVVETLLVYEKDAEIFLKHLGKDEIQTSVTANRVAEAPN